MCEMETPANKGSVVIKQTVKVKITDFEIVKALGKGAYGKVCLARKKTSGDYFAIKIIDKAKIVSFRMVQPGGRTRRMRQTT